MFGLETNKCPIIMTSAVENICLTICFLDHIVQSSGKDILQLNDKLFILYYYIYGSKNVIGNLKNSQY